PQCPGFLLGYIYRQEDHEYAGKSLYFHERMEDTARQDHESADSCARSQQDGAARSSRRGEADSRACCVRFELAVGDRLGNPDRSHHFWLHHEAVTARDGGHVVADRLASALLTDDNRGHALARHAHSLLRRGRDYGPRIRPNRTPVPIFRNTIRL